MVTEVDPASSGLKGIIPALITPMDEDGEVDYRLLEKQTAYLSDAGVDGLFIGGGTAEGAYLSAKEKKEIFSTVRNVSRGRQFLCAAYIRPSTKEVLEEMSALASCKPDYVVAVAPFYFSMRQEDIIAHYQKIAANSCAPVIIYNIPSTTHNPILLDTLRVLSEVDNIAGVKDSSGDFCAFSRAVLAPRQPGFSWIQGEDYLGGPSLMAGAEGIVSGLSNARIEPYLRMYAAARKGDWARVRAYQSLIDEDLYAIVRLCGNSISSVKVASELAGRGSRWMRQASLAVSADQTTRIAEILERYDSKLATFESQFREQQEKTFQ